MPYDPIVIAIIVMSVLAFIAVFALDIIDYIIPRIKLTDIQSKENFELSEGNRLCARCGHSKDSHIDSIDARPGQCDTWVASSTNVKDCIIAEIDIRNGHLIITKSNDLYTIKVDNIVVHPNMTADAAVRALAHYLHAAEYTIMFPQKKKDN